MATGRLDHVFNERQRRRRPRPVVDGDEVRHRTFFFREPGVERRESARRRFLAGSPTGTVGNPVSLRLQMRSEVRPPGLEPLLRQDDDEARDLVRSQYRPDGMNDERQTEDGQELLGSGTGAEPGAGTGCYDDRADPHGDPLLRHETRTDP